MIKQQQQQNTCRRLLLHLTVSACPKYVFYSLHYVQSILSTPIPILTVYESFSNLNVNLKRLVSSSFSIRAMYPCISSKGQMLHASTLPWSSFSSIVAISDRDVGVVWSPGAALTFKQKSKSVQLYCVTFHVHYPKQIQ